MRHLNTYVATGTMGVATVAMIATGTAFAATGSHHHSNHHDFSGHSHGSNVHDADILHGQFVRLTKSGTDETDDVQTGTVTDVSSTSITLDSTDGYTETYVIDSATKTCLGHSDTTIADGDTVTVQAVGTTTQTATTIFRHSSTTVSTTSSASKHGHHHS